MGASKEEAERLARVIHLSVTRAEQTRATCGFLSYGLAVVAGMVIAYLIFAG